MYIYAKKKNIIAPHGPFIFVIFILWLIHLTRLNWTYFIAVNYTDDSAAFHKNPYFLHFFSDVSIWETHPPPFVSQG